MCVDCTPSETPSEETIFPLQTVINQRQVRKSGLYLLPVLALEPYLAQTRAGPVCAATDAVRSHFYCCSFINTVLFGFP